MEIEKKKEAQLGAAAVEFAIVLPLLVTLVFGIVEFGLLLYDKAVITNAAREGVRAGIVSAVPRVTAAEISNVVTNYTDNNLVTFGAANTPVVTTQFGTQNFGDPLTVTVSYNYNYLFMDNFVDAIVGGTTLVSIASMNYE